MRLFGKVDWIISKADRTYFLMPPFSRFEPAFRAIAASIETLTLMMASLLSIPLVDASISIMANLTSTRVKPLPLVGAYIEVTTTNKSDRIRSYGNA